MLHLGSESDVNRIELQSEAFEKGHRHCLVWKRLQSFKVSCHQAQTKGNLLQYSRSSGYCCLLRLLIIDCFVLSGSGSVIHIKYGTGQFLSMSNFTMYRKLQKLRTIKLLGLKVYHNQVWLSSNL